MQRPLSENPRSLMKRRGMAAIAFALLALLLATPPVVFSQENEIADDEGEAEEAGIEEIITTPPAFLKAPAAGESKIAAKPKAPTAKKSAAVPVAPTASPSPAPSPEEAPELAAAEMAETAERGGAGAPIEEEAPLPPSVPPSARPPTATGRAIPFNSVVHSVDPSAPLFTMGKKKIRIVHLTTETRITRIDGTPATYEALEHGQEVRGAVRKVNPSEWEAISIKIGSKAAAATASLDE